MPEDIVNKNTDGKIKDYLLNNGKISETSAEWKNNLNNNKNKKFNFKDKKFLAALFLILSAILALAYFMYLKGQWSFDNEKVNVEIEAPSEVSSGEEITFALKYKNNTNVKLQNPRISFFAPKEFVFVSSDRETKKEGAVLIWNLDDLSAGESGKIRLFGRVIGKKGTECEFNSKISYIPDNFNYEFQSSNSKSKAKMKITAIPFEVSIECPKFVINKNEAKCAINYQNISNQIFKYVEIKAVIPKGFAYVSSEPEADENETYCLSWNIENLNPNASGELIMKGNITGSRNEEKEIEIILSASESDKNLIEYTSKKTAIKIQETPIILSQTINGKEEYFAYKGEELEYRIKFKNNSDMEIKGLVINSKLEGCVDFDSIDVVNGSYDSDYKITWSAFNIPKLAVFGVGEEEEVSFKVKVKDFIDIKNPNDKNFVIKNNVTIKEFNFDSESEKIGKTITSNKTVVKLDASLFIRAKGYFNDDGRIKNNGVIPPEVGKKTEYTIHWNLSSLLNDVKNVRIVSILPEKASWTGNYIKSNGEVSLGNENNGVFIPESKEEDKSAKEANSEDKEDGGTGNESESGDNFQEDQIEEERFYYNPETREIVWEIPELDANTGIILPAKEVVFQVSVTPEEDDVGKTLEIMDEVKATSQDEFTGNTIETLDSGLTTELPDDYSIGVEEGIVIRDSEG